ncbi:hypothetical protein FQN57_004870 [Myotisia sp. PD_48]|nr:hypothetical protein FQN57_004870 [Myotisia sp. PD_48]
MLFWEGDFRSGIEHAVQHSKKVVYDSEECLKWENEYLPSEEIRPLLESRGITLKLRLGSQGAADLAYFCPISEAPLLILIQNQTVREYIAAGTEEYMFKRRLKAALEDPGPTNPGQPTSPSASLPVVTQPPPNPDTPDDPEARAGAENVLEVGPQAQHTPSPTTSLPPPPTHIPEPETPRREVNSTQETVAEPTQQDPQTNTAASQAVWREQQRQRKQEQQQRQERERILGRIRHDAEVRKAKDELRKSITQIMSPSEVTPSTSKGTPRASSNQFRLQVRLLDGSSIRNTFLPTQNIRHDVRSWIDSERSDGDSPYILKHILIPIPNRTISDPEEEQSLADLGMGPTATLVMVPIKSYTSAYSDNANSDAASLPYRVISGGYNLAASAVTAVAGGLGSILGIGQNPAAFAPPAPTPHVDPSTSGDATETTPRRRYGRSNIRTLQDTNQQDQNQQFYNGNQVRY